MTRSTASQDRLRALARTLAPVQPRRALLAVGRHLGPSSLAWAANGLGALEQGRWLADTGSRVPNLPDRFAVFEAALRLVDEARRPLYLEFGVYRGRTLRWWSQHLRQPAARLVGFDSFEGLPEHWLPGAPAGTFVAGAPPHLTDERVSFVVGRFEETLPGWSPPPHDQLIVNLDCDLYSSSSRVLRWLTPHLALGALVYFDDLFSRDHQARALREWLEGDSATAALRPVAMARWGHHLLFRVDGAPAGPTTGSG